MEPSRTESRKDGWKLPARDSRPRHRAERTTSPQTDPRLREYHHDALEKDTLNKRPVEPRPSPHATVISIPRLGGLHIAVAGAKRHRTAIDSLSPLDRRCDYDRMECCRVCRRSNPKRLWIGTPLCHLPVMCRESTLLFRSTPMAGISDQIAV